MPIFEVFQAEHKPVLWLVFFELLALMCVILHVFACVSPLSTLGRLKFGQMTSSFSQEGLSCKCAYVQCAEVIACLHIHQLALVKGVQPKFPEPAVRSFFIRHMHAFHPLNANIMRFVLRHGPLGCTLGCTIGR